MIAQKEIELFAYLFGKEGDIYVSQIAKQINCTYSHVVKITNKYEDLKFLSFNKRGRMKYVKVLKKGQELADLCNRLMQMGL